MNDKNGENFGDPMFSDEEFLEVMEAQYEQAGRPRDRIAEHRVYERLRKLRKQKISWSGLAVAALVLLCLGPLWYSVKEDPSRIKGQNLGQQPLHAAIMMADGSQRPITTKVSVGQVLVFRGQKGMTGVPVLLVRQKGQDLRVEFVGEEFKSDESLLQKNGHVFGYKIEAKDRPSLFCLVVGASNAKARDQAVKLIRESNVNEDLCVKVSS